MFLALQKDEEWKKCNSNKRKKYRRSSKVQKRRSSNKKMSFSYLFQESLFKKVFFYSATTLKNTRNKTIPDFYLVSHIPLILSLKKNSQICYNIDRCTSLDKTRPVCLSHAHSYREWEGFFKKSGEIDKRNWEIKSFKNFNRRIMFSRVRSRLKVKKFFPFFTIAHIPRPSTSKKKRVKTKRTSDEIN